MQAFLDDLKLSIRTFITNPLRSLLTLLGIVIGVATVVAMMALIEGLRVQVNDGLSFLGANSFEVSRWPAVNFGPMDWRKYAKRKPLTEADVLAVAECPSVSAASAVLYQGAQKMSTAYAETRNNVLVMGGSSQIRITNALNVASGRFFTDAEDLDAREVVVLGPDVTDVVFPHDDPVGQEVRIKGRPFRVVGVLQRRGSILGESMDSLAIIPAHAFMRLYGPERAKSMDLEVQAVDAASYQKAQDEVTAVLRKRRGLAPEDETDFEINTNESNNKTVNEFSQTVTVAGFGVCLLSLLVGGIGILNIMLVSVTERTQEIGIRKALGARRRRIMMQFTTEAVMLSLVGGAIGIGLGFGVSALVNWVVFMPTQVPTWAVGLSLGMSSVVGLVFGIYPAARASRLDPVEAMRAD
jgi:putative ABC transport system permease protein